jgi:hypothetical protein
MKNERKMYTTDIQVILTSHLEMKIQMQVLSTTEILQEMTSILENSIKRLTGTSGWS